jgi:hypothetical protein
MLGSRVHFHPVQQADGLQSFTSLHAGLQITAKKVTVMLKMLNWVVNAKSVVF